MADYNDQHFTLEIAIVDGDPPTAQEIADALNDAFPAAVAIVVGEVMGLPPDANSRTDPVDRKRPRGLDLTGGPGEERDVLAHHLE